MRAGLLAITLLVVAASSLFAEESVNLPSDRIRSSSGEIAALIARGLDRSDRLRALVNTIDASNGIVYVEPGRCGRGVRACLVSVKTVALQRFLWIVVDAKKGDTELLGSIGHELHHAVEVLEHKNVRSDMAMRLLYARIGVWRGQAYETDEAIQAGNAVRKELRSH